MKILIIEDIENKKKKIESVVFSKYPDCVILDAAAYTTGLKKALNEHFDLIILDMSMPTYEKNSNETGGRFRTYGGKDIVRQLERKNKLTKFVVITQFTTFSEKSHTKTLQDIEIDLKNLFSNYFLGVIFYDTSSSSWKEELIEVLKKNA